MGRMKEIARKLDCGEPLTEHEQKILALLQQEQKERMKDFALKDALEDIKQLNKIDPQDD